MNIKNLSNEIEGGGCLVIAERNESILELDKNTIIKNFKDIWFLIYFVKLILH